MSLNSIWDGIKQRCNNPKVNSYRWYGKRGIKVCDRWLQFENFKKDMYESYLEHCKKYGKKQTTIDRLDNDKNYEPLNCRWATRKEQAQNKRKKIKEDRGAMVWVDRDIYHLAMKTIAQRFINTDQKITMKAYIESLILIDAEK